VRLPSLGQLGAGEGEGQGRQARSRLATLSTKDVLTASSFFGCVRPAALMPQTGSDWQSLSTIKRSRVRHVPYC
jgi:hypothetical protein